MEALLQTPISEPFMISAEFFFGNDPTCPFCGKTLDLNSAGDEFTCLNLDHCPYTTNGEIFDVYQALVGVGHDRLRAAQIAAKYTVDIDTETDPVTPAKFLVADETDANWVLKKIAHYESRLAGINAMIDNEIEAIEARRAKLINPLENQIDFFKVAFGPQLATWAAKRLDGEKKRSIDLLFGRIGFRKGRSKVIVEDDEQAIAVAEIAGYSDLVKVVKHFSKTAAGKLLPTLADDDPIRDVVRVQDGTDEFYITAESPIGD